MMKAKKRHLLMAAAVAGLVAGCATKTTDAGKPAAVAAAKKNGCAAKGGCGSKVDCAAKGGCGGANGCPAVKKGN